MNSFRSSLAYLSTTTAAPAPTLRQRCLRALTVVGCSWNLLGAALLGYFVFFGEGSAVATRLRVVGIAALMIGAAIFSIVIPLSRILLEDSHHPR